MSVHPNELRGSVPNTAAHGSICAKLWHSSTAQGHGLLTLCDGKSHGLQVWRRALVDSAADGAWVDVQGPIVLVGETLRVLSSKRVNAGLHRVVAKTEGRESQVFALQPNAKCVLKLEDFGGKGTVDMGDLFARITTSKFNINAKKELRDKERDDLRQHAAEGGIT